MHKRKKKNNKHIYSIIKRTLDIIFSFLCLIIFLPLMLIISLIIKIESPGPIIFKQARVGKNEKIFNIYKFRTMKINCLNPEYTKFGSFLRKSSLDELPQFFCILLGKMSFVGPRPWILDYYEYMNKKQKHRTDITPGLTGLAQIKETKNTTIFDKINYDLEYIKSYNFLEDFKIIILTFKTIIRKYNTYQEQSIIKQELEALKKINHS